MEKFDFYVGIVALAALTVCFYHACIALYNVALLHAKTREELQRIENETKEEE